MSLVLRRTVVGGGDWRFDNPSGRHHESKVVETSVTATDNSPSQDYTHPDDQATLLHVTPGFKPFTVCLYCLFCFCWYFCRLLSSVTLAILYLNAADIPLIKFVTSPPPLRIGQSVSLNCVANKSMAPVKVAWYREQKVLESGISEVVVTRNITSEDFGEYTCIAENHEGEDRKSVYLRGRMKTYKLLGYFSLLNKIFA